MALGIALSLLFCATKQVKHQLHVEYEKGIIQSVFLNLGIIRTKQVNHILLGSVLFLKSTGWY